MATTDETIALIAAQHLDIEILEEQGLDDLDFHEVGVLSIAAALKAAFEAGRQAGQFKATEEMRDMLRTLAGLDRNGLWLEYCEDFAGACIEHGALDADDLVEALAEMMES